MTLKVAIAEVVKAKEDSELVEVVEKFADDFVEFNAIN
jgi:hypothetical protein